MPPSLISTLVTLVRGAVLLIVDDVIRREKKTKALKKKTGKRKGGEQSIPYESSEKLIIE